MATGPRQCIITTAARIGKLLHDQNGILYALESWRATSWNPSVAGDRLKSDHCTCAHTAP